MSEIDESRLVGTCKCGVMIDITVLCKSIEFGVRSAGTGLCSNNIPTGQSKTGNCKPSPRRFIIISPGR